MEINYKSYIGKIWYSPSVKLFFGEIFNCDTLIAFQAQTPELAKKLMIETVDWFLAEISISNCMDILGLEKQQLKRIES